MCLSNCIVSVRNFLKVNKNRKKIKVWKWLYYSYGYKRLKSPIYSKHIWKSGTNISNSRTTKPVLRNKNLYQGIHVFITKPTSCIGYSANRIVELTANIDDLIGVNEYAQQAVFTKVHLTKKEYKRVTK